MDENAKKEEWIKEREEEEKKEEEEEEKERWKQDAIKGWKKSGRH